jgi:hypothetical protein
MPTYSRFDVGACNCATCTATFKVFGCAGILDTADTATVSVYDSTGTTLISSGTTTAGIVVLPIGTPAIKKIKVTGQNSRFLTYFRATASTVNCGDTLAVGGNFDTSLYCCSTACMTPIKNTLTASFSTGPVLTLTCDSSLNFNGWEAPPVSGSYVFGISGNGLGITSFNAQYLGMCLPGGNLAGTLNLSSFTCPPSFSANYTITGSCTGGVGSPAPPFTITITE